jgi:hypothetical protein
MSRHAYKKSKSLECVTHVQVRAMIFDQIQANEGPNEGRVPKNVHRMIQVI